MSSKCVVLAASMLLAGAAAFSLEPPPPAPAPVSVPGRAPSVTRLSQPGTAPPGAVANLMAADWPTNRFGPRIRFDTNAYDFGRVMSGDQVKHTFYFTNTGSQDLIINDARSSCGCTVVGDLARRVEPGGWGRLPVTFNTGNFNTHVIKPITVTCNDLSQPGGVVVLQLKGVVWRPVDVNPSAVALYLRPDFPYTSRTVSITNSLDQPLILSPPESSTAIFGAELKTNVFGRSYEVIISNTVVLPPGNAQGRISLKTSVTNIPVVDITTWANSQPLLTVAPNRIDLKQAPLPTNQLVYVTIINNSTNPLALSEPSVDAKGAVTRLLDPSASRTLPASASSNATPVDVTITETQRGRYFTLSLKFPTGFELPAGQPGKFTIKTTQPRMALLEVPIYQAARSARPALARARPGLPPSVAVADAARSNRPPVVLRRPPPPIPRPGSAVLQPPRAASPLVPASESGPPDPGKASSTNRPPPPPPPGLNQP